MSASLGISVGSSAALLATSREKGSLKKIKALSRLRVALNEAVVAQDAQAVTVADAVADDDPMSPGRCGNH